MRFGSDVNVESTVITQLGLATILIFDAVLQLTCHTADEGVPLQHYQGLLELYGALSHISLHRIAMRIQRPSWPFVAQENPSLSTFLQLAQFVGLSSHEQKGEIYTRGSALT